MPEAVSEDVAPRRSTQHLGVAMDAVTVGQQGVSFGFQIAKSATQMGAAPRRPPELLKKPLEPFVIYLTYFG